MGGGGSEGVVLTLACAGLPSAGKSTMINALAGTRFLETGVCRTTSKQCVLSATQPLGPIGLGCEWKCAEITSDDGVGLRVVDLPGVADAENTGTESNFTEMTLKWASECDVVVWVTDVRTCFLTTHEKLEYEKLKTALQSVAEREGKVFQFCVVLTKCDVEVTKTCAAGPPVELGERGRDAHVRV
jgi:predicted GTPase